MASGKGLLRRGMELRMRGRPQPVSPSDLASRIKSIELGFDGPAYLLQLLSDALSSPRAVLYVTDSRSERFVPCAGAGVRLTQNDALEVSAISPLLEKESPLVARASELPLRADLFGEDTSVRVHTFHWEKLPIGFLTVENGPGDQSSIVERAKHEIAVVLHASSDRAGSVRPARLSQLHQINPAGSSALMQISCDSLMQRLLREVPVLNKHWMGEFLLRLLASLFEPLGYVDRGDGYAIKLLTAHALDADLYRHQTAAVLARFLLASAPPFEPQIQNLS